MAVADSGHTFSNGRGQSHDFRTYLRLTFKDVREGWRKREEEVGKCWERPEKDGGR